MASDVGEEAVDAACQKLVKEFQPNDCGPLASLLLSGNSLAVRRALSIFSALGARGHCLLDAALVSTNATSLWARSNVMDGVLCYSRRLTAEQTARVLLLAADPDELILGKVSAFIGATKLGTIEEAVALMGDPPPEAHARGVRRLKETLTGSAQELFDEALASRDVDAVYALGHLERLARKGAIEPVTFTGDGYLGDTVAANIKRVIEAHKRSVARQK